jgi:hypothetical protein
MARVTKNKQPNKTANLDNIGRSTRGTETRKALDLISDARAWMATGKYPTT